MSRGSGLSLTGTSGQVAVREQTILVRVAGARIVTVKPRISRAVTPNKGVSLRSSGGVNTKG
jgi:hypothetical protein